MTDMKEKLYNMAIDELRSKMKSWNYSLIQQTVVIESLHDDVCKAIDDMIKEYRQDDVLHQLDNPLPDWIIEYITEITDDARRFFNVKK